MGLKTEAQTIKLKQRMISTDHTSPIQTSDLTPTLVYFLCLQVGGSLVDGIVFVDTQCLYVEDFVEDVFHSLYGSAKRITFSLYAGGHAPVNHTLL